MRRNERRLQVWFYFFASVIAFFVLGVCECKNEGGKDTAEKTYLAAVEAYAEEHYERAMELIRKVRRLDKRFYQAVFLEAKILFFQGKEAEAESLFHELIKKYPSYTEARIWYIRCLIISGQNEKAVYRLEEEISFNSTDWRVYYLYALLGQKSDNHEQRLSMNRKAEMALTESAKVYMDMALVWEALGMESRAREYLKKAEIVSGSNASIKRLEAALERAIGKHE
jgi:tetratricopeptide (TPR) repeat protein